MTKTEHITNGLEQAAKFLREHPDCPVIGVNDETYSADISLQVNNSWMNDAAPDDCVAKWHRSGKLSVWVTWQADSCLRVGGLFDANERCRWRGALEVALRNELAQREAVTQ